MTGKMIRAAVVQTGAVMFDTSKTLEKVALFSEMATAKGAQVVLFPEAFIGGYPKGLDFGSVTGGRTKEGREDYRRYFESSIAVPGPETDFVGRVASENSIFLVVGVIERDGSTLYCTALTFGPCGTLLARHRKVMPTAGERLIWGFGDGSTLPILDTPFGRMGSVICWENYMPLLRMTMYSKGIQIYCAPTADDRPSWAPSMQHIAVEGRCYVLSSCQFLKRGDCPEQYNAVQGNDPETILMRGGSCIVSPLGEILAGPSFDEETVLVADLDLGELARTKYDLDVAGHYARPDIFKLVVNESPTPPVVFRGSDSFGDP